MSTLLRLSQPRLIAAIERNGMTDGKISIAQLRKTLERRRMGDQDLHRIFCEMITALEPPPCYMTHCASFGGSGAPMNCGAGKVPGQCTILRDYKLRKVDREIKAAAKVNASAAIEKAVTKVAAGTP